MSLETAGGTDMLQARVQPPMEACSFCQIAAGERDAYVFYEDDRTVAFLDSNPATQGHTLVIPKRHREELFADDASASLAVFQTVQHAVAAINQTLDPDGISLFHTSAPLVGRTTHAHVHLLPRYVDDDIRLTLARDPLEDDEAVRLAARLRDQL